MIGINNCKCTHIPVADPGFSVGGAWTHYGGVDPQCGHFLVKMYAKTKELGPMGACIWHAPRSTNVFRFQWRIQDFPQGGVDPECGHLLAKCVQKQKNWVP